MKKRFGLKLISVFLSLVIMAATLPVFAATEIEITLKDVTSTNFTTLPGQAKVLVSLSGASEDIYRYQLAVKFSGDLTYKSIQYLAGENKPSEGTMQMFENPSDANRKGIVDAVVMSRDSAIDLSGKKLFIITFEGEPDEKVTVDVSAESENYFVSGSMLSDNEIPAVYKGTAIELTASNKAVKTTQAKIRITMDEFIEAGFNVNDDTANVDVKIYDAETGFEVVIRPGKESFNKDSNEFTLEETVLEEGTYTVEISAPGFTDVTKENVKFDGSTEIAVDNSEFRPGDINGDGEINSEDRDIIDELMANGQYTETADFNRDGKVNATDLEFLKDDAPSSKDEGIQNGTNSGGGSSGGGGGGGSSSSDSVVSEKLSSSEKVNVGEIIINETENGVSAYTYLKSVSVISDEVTVIGAMYNGDTLVATDIVKTGLVAGVNTRVDFEFPAGEYDRIETFVFNDLAKLMPYSSLSEDEEKEALPLGVLYALYNDTNGIDDDPKAVVIDSNGNFNTYGFAKNIVTNSSSGAGTDTVNKNGLISDFGLLGGNNQKLIYFELNANGEICKFLYDWGLSEVGYSLETGYYIYDGINGCLDTTDISEAEFITLSEPSFQTAPDKYGFGKMNGNGFIHGKGYSAQVITTLESDEAVFGIVFDYSPYLSGSSDIMYVTSVSDISDDDGNILRLFSGYVNNEKASFAVDMNEDVYVYDKNETLTWDIFGIHAGNVIQYNLAGEAPVIKVLLSEQDVYSIASDNLSGNLLGTGIYDSFRGFMQAGSLSEYCAEDGSSVFTDGTVLEIGNDAPVMLLRADGSRIDRVFAGPEFGIECAETNMSFNWDENDDKVWVYKFGGETRAVVIIDTHYDNEFEKAAAFSGKVPSFGIVSPYSDLQVSDASFEEFYALSKLGYMGGFSDGTVRPEAEITGAEFIALLIKSMGLEKLAAILYGEETPFADASHWASGYLSLALNRGIIREEEGFEPSEGITYEMAVVYTVRALGYAPVCNTNIKAFMKAAELGITGGISQNAKENATRRTVAELLYNSLNVPLMEITSIGSEVNYAVPGDYETLLSGSDIARIEGYVSSVSFDENCKITFSVTSVAPQFDASGLYAEEGLFAPYTSQTMKYSEGMDIIQYLPVVAYVDVENPDEPVMIFMTGKGSGNTVSLKRRQMIGGYYYEGDSISYYKNSCETDSRATEVKINYDTRIYVNSGAMEIPAARFTADYSAGIYPEVMLIDIDSSIAGYDIILAKEYRSGVISKIDYNAKKISFCSGNGATDMVAYLDGCVSITDGAGNPLKLSEVKTGNVINIAESWDEDGNSLIEATVTDNIIEGTVESYAGSGYYTVNGEEYYSDADFGVGVRGYFFIDMYGKIVGYSDEEPVIGEGGTAEDEPIPEEEISVNASMLASPFADLDANDACFNAFYTLNFLDVLKGYEDGTAKPENSITRAELVAVLVRALGYEEVAKNFRSFDTCFEDVTAEHWAAGYVNVALNCGILEEGKYFRPGDVVSYGDAVKFTVGALGYTPLCEIEGDGSDLSYLYVASKLGLITDEEIKYSDETNRRIAAELIYKALEVDMMEQVTVGSNPSYAVPNDAETMLSKMQIARIDGYVNNISFAPSERKLTFEINGISKQYDGDLIYNSGNGLYSGYNDFVYDEGVQISKFVSSRAYVNMKDINNPVIMGMYPTGGDKLLTLTSKQMRDGYADLSSGYLEYYKNSSEEDSKCVSVRLSSYCEVYSNMSSMPLPVTDFINKYRSGMYPKVTLIDNNPYMNGYDIILVDEYYSGIVEKVDIKNFSVVFSDIYNSARSALYFGSDGDYTFDITDENGNELTFTDIRIGDVLTVFESEDYDAYIYMKVIVSRNILEGRVYTVTDNGNIVIDGKEYHCSPDVVFNVGDKGKFYTDIYGNIIRFEKELNLEYGVLGTVYSDIGSADIGVNAVIFGEDNQAKTYSFADKVKVTSDDYAEGYRIAYESEIASNFAIVGGENPRPVAYKLNAQGEINELYYGYGIKYAFENLKLLAREGRYYASEEAISGVKITDDTLIINVSESGYPEELDADSVTLMEKSELGDGDYLSCEMFVNMTVGEELAELLVIYNIEKAGSDGTGESGSPPDYTTMYVTFVSATVDAENNELKNITGTVNGTKVTLTVPYSGVNMYDVYGDFGSSVDMIGVGSVIQYLVDEYNQVTDIRVLLSYCDVQSVMNGEYNIRISNDEDDCSAGYIYSGKLEKSGNETVVFEDGTEVCVSSSLQAMLICGNRVYTSDMLTVYVAETYEYTMDDMSNGDYVWIYKFDGETKAVVIFDSDCDDIWN